jgi:hypothetical protein
MRLSQVLGKGGDCLSINLLAGKGRGAKIGNQDGGLINIASLELSLSQRWLAVQDAHFRP